MIFFCNCDEPKQRYKIDGGTFPSMDQVWGMVVTVIMTIACWLLYSMVICLFFVNFIQNTYAMQRYLYLGTKVLLSATP